MNRISKHWPEYYSAILDFVELSDTETIELDLLDAALQLSFDNQFVNTSNERAIARRERMLGIQADPTSESLAFRKQRILNRYQTHPPFTVRYLQQQLDRLVGPGMTIVSVDVQNFILFVTTNVENANIFREVQHTVQTVKPANMVYQQNTSLEGMIEVEEHISKQTITWNYKLDGSWQPGEKPFASLGEEVVIK
jgi:hypothetical protein